MTLRIQYGKPRGNCDDCGLGWWPENGIVWEGVVPPTLEEWEGEWRKWEEEWKEEEGAQTLVLLAHKLHQLPLKMVAAYRGL